MKPFDEHLYERKLQEPCDRMHRETLLRRRHAQAKHAKHGQGLGTTFLVRQIDSDLGVLRDVFLPDVDRMCRETWLSDHEAITPAFIRTVLVPHVFTTIAARKGAIRGDLELLAGRTGIGGTGLTPALHHLAMEIGHLEAEIANRYEIEAIEFAKQVERNVAAISTVRTVTAAPVPLASVVGLGLAPHPTKPREVPSNPPGYFPSDLWSRPLAQNGSWKDFRERFIGLAREEQGRAVVVTEGEALRTINKLVRASCNYGEHPEVWETGKPEQGCFCLLETPPYGVWGYSDGMSENFLERVRLCVAEAGRALPDYPKGTDAEEFWLHRLYLNLVKHNSDQLFAASQEGGMIVSVCVASATFCSRLEREALEDEHSSKQLGAPSQQIERGTTEAMGRLGQSPFDQGESLRNAILYKGARIAEVERILNRPPLTEYRGQPVHGGQNWRLRLEEERQHLLIAISELESELERLSQAGVSSGSSAPTTSDPQSNAPKSEVFAHSDDYRSVTVRGQNFTLTSRQAQVIQILDENRRKGVPEVGKDYLLEKLGTTNSRLRDSFKTNLPAWKVLVKAGTKKGTVRLNV
jgi:hypothetical protein